ncbi:MAG: MaoC family dehydratase [Fimbriimonadaceae bacterium]|nr:MaoC family dehydratase [Alphaproteobacteria bacterium]
MDKDGKLCFEDFPVGETVIFDATYPVTREEIVEFATEFDPQPIHLSDVVFPEAKIDGMIASGWHTAAMSMRLMSEGYISNSHAMGSPGMDHLKWLKPVKPGDVLRMRRTCLEARRSNSRRDMGIVKFHWEVLNQNDEVVMDYVGHQMMRTQDSFDEEPA